MSEKQINKINYKPKPIFMGNGEVWDWQSRFKSLESATEFLLDHVGRIIPITEALLRRNARKEKEINTLLKIIKTLEGSTINGNKSGRSKI